MWAKVIIGILGLGAIAAAAAKRRDDGEPDVPPGPGPLLPGDVPSMGMSAIPAEHTLNLTGVKIYVAKATSIIPTLKGVPANLRAFLGDLFCTGGTGVTRTPTILTSQIKAPTKVNSSWTNLYGWCVADVKEGTYGLPAGIYLSVWPYNGAKLAFGPFQAYVPGPKVAGRPSTVVNVQDGLKSILAVSVKTAKGWAIK